MTRARSLSQLANSNVFTVDGGNNRIGIGSTTPDAKLDVQGNIEVAGIITAAAGFAVTYFGDGSGLTGVASTDNIVTGTAATFNNQVTIQNLYVGAATTIQGTLSYEDVTNVDSLGIITARSDVSIADKIIHTGDTNTAIRFPANDTFTVETAGAEAIRVDNGQRLLIGATSSRAVAVDQSALQVQGTGGADSSLVVIRHSANINPPYIYLGKSRSATLGESAAVEEDDGLGFIRWAGADGTDANTFSAQIGAEVDGSVSGNTVPGRLIFSTAPAGTLIERLRITSSGLVGIGTDNPGGTLHVHGPTGGAGQIYVTDGDAAGTSNSFLISKGGTTTTIKDRQASSNLDFGTADTHAVRIDSSQRVIIGETSSGAQGNCELQVHSGGNNVEIIRNTDNAFPARLRFTKTRGSFASPTAVQNNDELAEIRFIGHDGADYENTAAGIRVEVDGSVAENNTPARLMFYTNPGQANFVERLRIGSAGQIGLGGANYGTAGQVLTSNGSGSAVSWEDASGGGITTEAATPSNAVVQINLTDATDHKITATGICTITSTTAGTEGQSHTIRIVNSGIATVGFSTYFLFPSGSAPSLPTADGAVSLISFTVHDSVGAGCTQLLAGASVNFS